MLEMTAHKKLKSAFLQHQCRVRQIIVRKQGGRPNAAIMPQISIGHEPIGQIITLLNKLEEYSKLPEIKHVARHTHDPAVRIEKMLKLLSEYYYQYAEEFSDVLTASFGQASAAADKLLTAKTCRLHFSAYGQDFILPCQVSEAHKKDYYYQSGWWHNYLFNPNLAGDTRILAFHPIWQECRAEPEIPTLSIGDNYDEE